MSKQVILGVAAAVIIILGAGGVFLYSQNKPTEENPTPVATTQNENEDSSMSSDLTAILKSGKTQQCTFSYEQDGSTTNGVTYISGDKMRTEVNSTVNGKSSTIYVVRNGDDNYIWGSDFPNNTGMKMSLSIDDFASSADSKKYFDPTKKLDYKCGSWSLNVSVFTPPANVKFQDLSAMMKGLVGSISKVPTGAAVNNSDQCNICNSLSGDAKTTCRTQLNCK